MISETQITAFRTGVYLSRIDDCRRDYGDLVAVAIPIYGGLTNRAERQTCHSNCEIIEKAAVQYLITAGNDTLDDIAPLGNPVTVESQADAEAKFPPAFLACFEGGTFPECPSENCHYTISYNNDSVI